MKIKDANKTNSLGLTIDQMNQMYPDITTEIVKNTSNKHLCWNKNGYCILCKERIPEDSELVNNSKIRNCRSCNDILPQDRYFNCVECNPNSESDDGELTYFQLNGREEDDLILEEA